jgi:hypothetical protein
MSAAPEGGAVSNWQLPTYSEIKRHAHAEFASNPLTLINRQIRAEKIIALGVAAA